MLNLNRVLVICGIIMIVFLGALAHHEGDRQTSAEINREIRWEQTHQVIVPR